MCTHFIKTIKENEIFGKKIEGDWNINSKAVALIFVSVTDASESL